MDHPDDQHSPLQPDPDPTPPDSEGNEDFARLLEASMTQGTRRLRAGDQITGTIIQIGEVDSFVDCGERSELPIATQELAGPDGKLKLKVGDRITAHVQGSGDQKRLTMALHLRGQDLSVLERARQDGTPLAGVVRETNKGGFTVDLGGRRAFCPFSQIDLHRVTDPAEYVGRELPFRILELSQDGRNIVVSRRALLQQERDRQAQQRRSQLNLGEVCDGTVTRLAPFGAFVDIGGIEGLVHVSELSHQRINDPATILKVGEPVRVKILEIQNLGQGSRERITLSMKALAEDPWPATVGSLTIGTDMPGRVTRLMDYGAFVELAPGIEGLIHISEMATRRIRHPREVISEQEEVTVRILDIDPDRRRISLSLKEASGQLKDED
jgi:small subunit ribosomal protein S1